MNIKPGQRGPNPDVHTIRIFDADGEESLRLESSADSTYPIWTTFLAVAKQWDWMVPPELLFLVELGESPFGDYAVKSWPIGTQYALDNWGENSLGTMQWSMKRETETGAL